MSSFIIQLLIISAVVLMVRSAPVSVTNDHLQKRQANDDTAKELEIRLYCAAKPFHDKVGPPGSEPFNKMISATTLNNTMFDHLSTLCKNFTIATALKHLLQDLLLSTTELSSKNTKKLTTILTKLQTMANTFDDMQYNKHGTICVKFTPAQYWIMYSIKYNNKSMSESLTDMKQWYKDKNYYEHTRENLGDGRC